MPVKPTKNLDLATLRRLLRYDMRTGEMTWKENRGRTAKAGDEAGTLLPNGSVMITVKGHQFLANRLAWFYVTGEMPPGRLTTHNGDPSDLRWSNIVLESELWVPTKAAAYQREYRRRRFYWQEYGMTPGRTGQVEQFMDLRDPRHPGSRFYNAKTLTPDRHAPRQRKPKSPKP
jgi:hypothetical protein